MPVTLSSIDTTSDPLQGYEIDQIEWDCVECIRYLFYGGAIYHQTDCYQRQ